MDLFQHTTFHCQSLLLLFISLRADFCTLCDSSLCAYSNTCSLVVSLLSSSVAPIPLSLCPLINCSESNLWYSLNWHFAALDLSLPIHSCADSLFFLCKLWYCSNIIIPLCCILKLLLWKGPLQSYISDFVLGEIQINCRPSQPNQCNHWDFFFLSKFVCFSVTFGNIYQNITI